VEGIDRLRRREPAALQAVVDENGRRLFRAARAWGLRTEEAEDVVQEVFVTFLETLDRFEGRSRVSTWLYGILHHKCLERGRVRAREQSHDPIDEAFEARFDASGGWKETPVDLDRLVGSSETGAAIEGCLGTLPQPQRDVFVLRLIEELPAADVARILGRTVTHVGVLLHRARTRLRTCLEGRGWAAHVR